MRRKHYREKATFNGNGTATAARRGPRQPSETSSPRFRHSGGPGEAALRREGPFDEKALHWWFLRPPLRSSTLSRGCCSQRLPSWRTARTHKWCVWKGSAPPCWCAGGMWRIGASRWKSPWGISEEETRANTWLDVVVWNQGEKKFHTQLATYLELLLLSETAKGTVCGLSCHQTHPREHSHSTHDAGDFSGTHSDTASGPPAHNAHRNTNVVPGIGVGVAGVCFPATVALVKILFCNNSFPSNLLIK